MPMALCGLFHLSLRRAKEAGSSKRVVEAFPIAPGARDFTFTVPDGVRAGASIRIQTSDDRLFEIVLPKGCKPGQKITMALGRDGLQELRGVVLSNYQTSKAECASLKVKLAQELEQQRIHWEWDGDLSHQQSQLFAAAESEDSKQLADALKEVRKSGPISKSLKECFRKLTKEEEVMVTWRCLMDALLAENRSDVVFWSDEARKLGLTLPDRFLDTFDECHQDAERNASEGGSQSRSVRELYEECTRRGIDTRGCGGKVELEELLRNAPPEVIAPEAKGFVKKVPAAYVPKASDTGTVWSRKDLQHKVQSRRHQHMYLLGIDCTTTEVSPTELRAAYRKAAMECHPDRQQNHDRQEEAKDLFQKVKDSFDYIQHSR